MRIFTKEVAESVAKYYSEIVIGKPITPPGNSNPFPIASLEITKIEDGYSIKCVSKYTNKTMRRNLDEIIPELDALPLDEFLSNLN